MPTRLLSKSGFVHALECPARLYYSTHKETYATRETDNEFLKILAEGGIQVGELAKLYHPEGIEIQAGRDKEKALHETNTQLQKKNVTLFEAAVRHENTYVLVDILIKTDQEIRLIEVKSKSWDNEPSHSTFFKKNGQLKQEWQKYLYDVAFQARVLQKAFPDVTIRPFLMLVDKQATATIDGLHSMFKIIQNEDGRSDVKLAVNPAAYQQEYQAGHRTKHPAANHPAIHLGEPILTTIDVSEAVDAIHNGRARDPISDLEAQGFDAWIQGLCAALEQDQKIPSTVGAACKNCPYRVTPEQQQAKLSGFRECWTENLGWGETEFAKPHAFDVWNARAAQLAENGLYLMEDITPAHLGVDESALVHKCSDTRTDKGIETRSDTSTDTRSDKGTNTRTQALHPLYLQPAWSYKERQLVQVMKMTGRHDRCEVLLRGLYEKMERWTYPLHFIDFEGIRPAIPFHKGCRPYMMIPFQFSVHSMDTSGQVHHTAEWIDRRKATYPGFDFIRNLKKVLEKDSGSVFMYSHFEKTALDAVKDHLEESTEPDKNELTEWIGTLTSDHSERRLIDLQRWVLQHYYSVHMGGSNSIKDVLPAVLQESEALQTLYSKPYSGLSLKNQILFQRDEHGEIINPYKLLEPIGYGIPDETEDIDLKTDSGIHISEGGSAMMAWARMQFDDVSEAERARVFDALLRYCELDTLAMVMIVQHWISRRPQLG